MHIFGWDLDRTYLDTEIHSLRGLLRAAVEHPSQKRTVPGAAPLARGLLAANADARLRFLSGSPRQMRSSIEQKLAIDGVTFDRLTLKDNLRNLRRGRFRAMRAQVGYKLPALLTDRASLEPETTETWFGDDSEKDALIYAVYAELVAGRMDAADVGRLLDRVRAYPDAIEKALTALERIPRSDAVEDIFIRLDQSPNALRFARLGQRVHPVASWFQAAMVLHERGRLPVDGVAAVAEDCRLEATPAHWTELVVDAVRRRLVTEDAALTVLESVAPTLTDATRSALATVALVPLADFAEIPDYLGFLDLDGTV